MLPLRKIIILILCQLCLVPLVMVLDDIFYVHEKWFGYLPFEVFFCCWITLLVLCIDLTTWALSRYKSMPLFIFCKKRSSIDNVFEIVTWNSKPNVIDEEMIKAVDRMVADLKHLHGFLNQTLYKDEDRWVNVYYWKTEKDTNDSKDAMADKESLKKFMSIIETDTVTMKVLSPKQSSGEMNFQFEKYRKN